MRWRKKGRGTSGRLRRRRRRLRARLGGSGEFAAEGADLNENFRRLLASPAIASKHWITEQYDSMVRTNTRFGPGAGDAAVMRLKETKRAGAFDGRKWTLGIFVAALGRDACRRRGGAERGLHGARPVAATNCLNFGNPEKPEVMWQFTEAIDGIAEACRRWRRRLRAGTSASTTRRWGSRFIRRRCWACWD